MDFILVKNLTDWNEKLTFQRLGKKSYMVSFVPNAYVSD